MEGSPFGKLADAPLQRGVRKDASPIQRLMALVVLHFPGNHAHAIDQVVVHHVE
jgi:hypothetical protein